MKLCLDVGHVLAESACTWLHAHAGVCPATAYLTCIQYNIWKLQTIHELSVHSDSQTSRPVLCNQRMRMRFLAAVRPRSFRKE